MVRTHADGLADLKALTSAKLSGCVQQILVPELNKGLPAGATVSNLQIKGFAPSGVPGDSFGLRIALNVTVPQEGSDSVAIDIIGFLDGRAEVALDATQTGGDPSTSLEQELLSFLVTRAQQ